MEAGGEVTREKTRIYVGGLGGGVTEDDLRKTFSALGEVVAIDVVRTKGRSFAYLDFLPSTDKSLQKLFSTYNGCMWKGGKLRLEKAKEHYLLRLRREWQEEAEHAGRESKNCDADPSESHDTLEKPKKPSSDKMQFHIFFPKLRKVKSLTSVGIGKHKYSFQRAQVPSIPTHFCDCEEHSLPFLTTNKQQSSESENASGGINEQELNIMNSVMNKIFERENTSKQVIGKSESVNGRGISMNSNDKPLVENDEEDHLTDEDNLIINVATGKTDNLDLLGEMRTMMLNQEPVAKRSKTSSKKPKNVHDSQEKKIAPPGKKRKSPREEENESNDTVIPETARNSQIHLNTQEDSKAELGSGTKQLRSNSIRSKKSPWKDLIGQKGNTPFSISDIIASVPQEKEEEFVGNDVGLPLTKSIQDTPRKKNLLQNKKRKSDGYSNEMASSVPETSSSTLHINKEATTEICPVTKEISIPDILPNDSQQKGEEPGTDLDMPLTKVTQPVSESDIHPSASQQKEEDPRNDDLDMRPTISQQLSISDVLPSASQRKEEEPRTDDLDLPLTLKNENSGKHENGDSKMGNSKDLEKLTDASPAKHNEDLIRTARGDSWRHKSSWTQLISNTGNTPFSISQVVPNLSFEKHEQQVDIHKDSADTSGLEPANKNPNDQSPAMVVTEQLFSEMSNATRKNVLHTSSPLKKKISEQKRTSSLGNLESEETCLFMRTEASMKEWKKAKASLSSSLNKKKRSVKE